MTPDLGARSRLDRAFDAFLGIAPGADAGGPIRRPVRPRMAGALAEPGRVERSQVRGAVRATARGAGRPGRRTVRRACGRMDAAGRSRRSRRACAGAGVIASHALREGPAGHAQADRQSDSGGGGPPFQSTHGGRVGASGYRHGELLKSSSGSCSRTRGEGLPARSQGRRGLRLNAGGSGQSRLRRSPGPGPGLSASRRRSFPFAAKCVKIGGRPAPQRTPGVFVSSGGRPSGCPDGSRERLFARLPTPARRH